MPENYPVHKTLKDGSTVSIRVMVPEDEEKSLAFFRSLPVDVRQYLPMDLTCPNNIRKRMCPGPFQRCWRIVAEKEGKICGDATLCGPMTGWMRHTSEIRCVVHPDHQRKGLGSLLLWELYQKALSERVDIVFCEIMEQQKAALHALAKLGFQNTLVREKHVKAIDGVKHDLHIVTKDVNEMWDTLKNYIVDLDTPRR